MDPPPPTTDESWGTNDVTAPASPFSLRPSFQALESILERRTDWTCGQSSFTPPPQNACRAEGRTYRHSSLDSHPPPAPPKRLQALETFQQRRTDPRIDSSAIQGVAAPCQIRYVRYVQVCP